MSQTLAAGSGGRVRTAAGRPDAARANARAGARGPVRSPARPPRPTLRVVAAPVAERSRTLFVVGALALLVGGLITLLLVNTALAAGSFRTQDLTATSRALADQSQALSEGIALQAAPQRLSAKAAALGMVPSGSVAFLRLSDGKVLGVAKPATAAPTPSVTSTPPTVTAAPGTPAPSQPTTPTASSTAR